jgi:hypothetical protein
VLSINFVRRAREVLFNPALRKHFSVSGHCKGHCRQEKARRKMKIESHIFNDTKIAEITSDETIISTSEDGLDLLGNIYYQGFDGIVLNEKNITPDFFELKSGIAGEILQKFSTYQVRLAIVGDFSKYTSKSLTDFIYESNKGRHINFVNTTTEALKILSS